MEPPILGGGDALPEPPRRPWKLRLQGAELVPRVRVKSWGVRFVKPRRTDAAIAALGLLSFSGAAAIEVYGLVFSPWGAAHPVAVVASLVLISLVLGTCSMGLVVWAKGPEWAEDDRQSSLADRDRPPAAPGLASAGSGSESEDDVEHRPLMRRGRPHPPADRHRHQEGEEEFCYNCLLDECTAMVGAIVAIVAVATGAQHPPALTPRHNPHRVH